MTNRTCDEPGCNGQHRARGKCVSHYNSLWPSPNRRRKYERTCLGCGRTSLPEKREGKCCSEACWGSVIRRRNGRTTLAIPRQGRAWHDVITLPEPHRPRVWTCGQCRTCGKWFTSQYTQVTCSDDCQRIKVARGKRAEKALRRARERQADATKVNPLAIFERDGWRCQICRKPVDPGLPAQHPRAATLDHIVPLAWVGAVHDLAHWRRAHRDCNSRRGARGDHAQPYLFG